MADQIEELREEVAAWLDEHGEERFSVEAMRGLRGRQRYEIESAWTAKLREGNWLCPTWPEEHGGRGYTRLTAQELDRAFLDGGYRRLSLGMGEGLVGPSIIVWGTDEQKARFLPRILDGNDVYCQGFSEPDAGSDLASLTTRGEIDGDELIITGQKVWTSGARAANLMFCLCRTDPDAPKHAGITYVLVPMHDNNIEVRPLRQITGGAEFNEVFLDGARAPVANVIGGLNEGWRVSMTTLGNERSTGSNRHETFARMIRRLIDEARQNNKTDDAVVRQQLARMYTDVEIMRYASLRHTASAMGDRDPGPSASIEKIFWTEFDQRLGELAMNIIGPSSQIVGEDYRLDRWQREFLWSRSHTIWGGTAQVQRNIVGERVLGLPKEPDHPS